MTEKKCTERMLEKWIDTYDKLIFSICYKLTGDYFAAEDLAQETFLSAYQKYHSFDGTNEKAWLCRIATNKSIDYMRSTGRKAILAETAFFEAEQERRGSPEEICLEEEVKRNLQEKCNSLKEPYGDVARDYYLYELSPQEIARKRGCNLKTVQTRIYRAREMLRKLYGKEEPT